MFTASGREAKHRTPDTVAACGKALALYEKHTGNSPLRLLKRFQGIQSMLYSTTVSPLRGKVNSELSSGRCGSLPYALSVDTPHIDIDIDMFQLPLRVLVEAADPNVADALPLHDFYKRKSVRKKSTTFRIRCQEIQKTNLF